MKKQVLSNILFIDIECVPAESSFFDLDPAMQELREKKWARLAKSPSIDDEARPDELYDNRSGIFPEFGKIIVISVWGIVKQDDGSHLFRSKSFYGDDEKKLLEEFFELLNAHYSHHKFVFCGHNIKEFDIPYICRRATVHGLRIPDILDSTDKKPREVNHIDTMELWKYGARRSFISLDLLCRSLWVQTPKTDISWEQVARAYRDDKDLERIKQYCERDILAVAEVLLKFYRSRIELQDEDEAIV